MPTARAQSAMRTSKVASSAPRRWAMARLMASGARKFKSSRWSMVFATCTSADVVSADVADASIQLSRFAKATRASSALRIFIRRRRPTTAANSAETKSLTIISIEFDRRKLCA